MRTQAWIVARMVTGLLAGLVLLVASVGGATARSAIMVIDIDLDSGVETFTTDSPLLCPSGDAFTDFRFGAGNFNEAGTYHLYKSLVCDDGSGSFVIKVSAGENFLDGGGTTGGWSVVPGSGTGDYAGLFGGGNIVGTRTGTQPVDLIDHYYGSLQL